MFLVPDLMYRALNNSEISSNTNVAQATEWGSRMVTAAVITRQPDTVKVGTILG